MRVDESISGPRILALRDMMSENEGFEGRSVMCASRMLNPFMGACARISGAVPDIKCSPHFFS
jgi:hypothetical protein